MSRDDFAFEPVRGLPGILPRGERILWQGAPDWRSFARRAFLTRAVAIYFGAIAAFRIGEGLAGTMTPWDTAVSVLWQAGLGGACIAILAGVAWLYARTTVYTITNRRVVMRFGLVVDLSVNLPFKQIASAALKRYPNGTGEIPLRLAGNDRLAYLHMWPNARPWRFRSPEPMLRCVPGAEKVAGILADALSAFAEEIVQGRETGSAIPAATPARPEPARPQPAAPVAARDLQPAT